MPLDITQPTESQSRNRFWDVALIAATLTAIFHFLPANRPFGFAMAIFIVCLGAAMVMMAGLAQKPLSRWPLLFLGPALFCAVADALYSSPVTQVLAFFVSLLSLTFFAFWLFVPKTAFRHIGTLWPWMFIKETLWPLKALAGSLTRIRGDKRWGGILVGLVIAVPFILVFSSVFASADQAFSKSLSDIFAGQRMGEYIAKTIRDFIVAIFFLASGLTMLGRLAEGRQPKQPESKASVLDQTVFVTFLGLLNILFLVFVGFQFAYFFGGQGWVTAQGITYAEYAREGFFQLLFAAGLVFAIAAAIYWLTDMRQRWTKILAIALIVQTGIIIVSALKRLLLYIDVYGLTLSRWWAAFCILLIGSVLLLVAGLAIRRLAYAPASKFVFIAVLWIVSAMLCFNSEAFIARYNIDRFLQDKADMDSTYVSMLSADALPEIVRLVDASWPDDPLYREHPEIKEEHRRNYADMVRTMGDGIKRRLDKNPLGASLSMHWAVNAVDSLR